VTSSLTELLAALGTALAAGFLVGAERERRSEPSLFGGARTFPMYSLLGAFGMLLGPWMLVALTVVMGSLIAIAYVRDTGDRGGMGMSSQVAALATFALGALCTARDLPLEFNDRLLVVAAGATAILSLLSFKKPLHGLIARVSEEDIYATSTLLVFSVIVLPLLPNREMGPWQALNPRHIGLLVVLISGIGFAGYVAIRIFGPRRGLGLTGLLGGLASSTAVTLTFAGRARQNPQLVGACAVAVVLASSTMFPRMIVEIYAVSPSLGQLSLIPFATATLTGLGMGGILYTRGTSRAKRDDAQTELEVQNPFSVTQALKFAAVFTVVLVIARAASVYLDDAGAYLAAFVTGIADVDAITLSLARLHEEGELDSYVALDAIGIAAFTNTVSKVGLASILGSLRLGMLIGLSMAVALASGILVRLLMG
jgi:uncharacterized membrane protein (DUF4010 family)